MITATAVLAVRAFTAARLYLNDDAVPTLAAAAESCGSNVAYVRAAITLVKTDNPALVSDVLAGQVPILQAAAQVRPVVDLVTAYREAKDPDRVAFARACGAEAIFNVLVAASSCRIGRRSRAAPFLIQRETDMSPNEEDLDQAYDAAIEPLIEALQNFARLHQALFNDMLSINRERFLGAVLLLKSFRMSASILSGRCSLCTTTVWTYTMIQT